MKYMSIQEAMVVAALKDRAEIGKVQQALDVLFDHVTELEREKQAHSCEAHCGLVHQIGDSEGTP